MSDHKTQDKPGGAHPSAVVPAPDLGSLPEERLERMHDAAAIILQSESDLAEDGKSVVGEMLRDQGEFRIWESYPKGDVFDDANHSHYFYHAHDPREMAEGENGHFHLFVRPFGLDPALAPMPLPGAEPPADPQDRFIHIGGISVDAHSRPLRVFTTNVWVTNETFFKADDIIPLLDRFQIDVAQPDPRTSAWVTAMVRLYRPEFEAMLRRRDEVLQDWMSRYSDQDVAQDRRLQITSEVAVDLPGQIARIESALFDGD